MGMKYMKFAPCPECTEDNTPRIANDVIYTGVYESVSQTYHAVCRTCGYETKRHSHVIDIVKEWNAASFEKWPFKDNYLEGLQ